MALTLLGCGGDGAVPIGSIEAPVAYVSHPDAGSVASRSDREMMIMDAMSGETWQLTSDGARDGHPTWSPDGKQLMFISDRNPSGLGLMPSWSTGTGWNRLFIYDLEKGMVSHVDLSWAYDSGPAKARESDLIMRSLGWLGCAAWSPVDENQVAIWVIVRNAHWKDPSEREQMIAEEYRVVLLDLEAKTGRLLAVRNDACGRLDWSPDGSYLILHGSSRSDYLNVKTGNTFSIDLPRGLGQERRSVVLTDWKPREEQLLIRELDVDGEADAVYTYDIRDSTLSRALGVFAETMQVSEYMPLSTSQDTLDFLVRQYSHTTYHSDLWRYRQVTGKAERLTRDGMPKLNIRSYHGQSNI